MKNRSQQQKNDQGLNINNLYKKNTNKIIGKILEHTNNQIHEN